MLWGTRNDTTDETRHSIQPPPPTPGLASWAFNSLFSKQSPSSKYAEMAKAKKASTRLPREDLADNKDDTFYNRKNQRTARSRRFNDDTLLNSTSAKNVAWGGNDFRIRTRSSSFSEAPQPKASSYDFYKDKELLPDVDDKDFEFNRSRRPASSYTRSSNEPRSHSASRLEKSSKTSLPPAFPGKFPSPYVPRDSSPFNSNILSSSASKNLKAADYNTERNRNLSADPQPIERPAFYKRSYLRNTDDTDVLKSIDQNISDLNNITRSIERLKVDGAATSSRQYQQLQRKYDDVKQELIGEFRKSKKMYDSYYNFMDKYKELKQDYSALLKKSESESSEPLTRLQKEITLLQEENKLLTRKIEITQKKIQDDDTEVLSLKSTLQNSSKFEGTLRRKIKYLEDKIEDNIMGFKQERFKLNEKVFLLESKLKDEEERHDLELRKAQERIEELERRLESRRSSDPNLSIIPEYGVNELSIPQKNPRRSHAFGKENETLDFLNDKYPDRNTKDSPDKYYGRETRNDRRPASLQVPSSYKLSDLKDDFAFSKFDKIDESTTTFDFKRLNSLKGAIPQRYANRHSNNSFPDLTFNASEI